MATVIDNLASTKRINIEAINKAVALTPRVERLKRMRLDNRVAIVSAERARLYVESWKETAGNHPAIRRAKAFKHFLQNQEIIINDDELLVGTITKHPRGAYPNPQEFPSYVSKVITDGIKFYGDSVKEAISQEDIDTLLACCEYWASDYPGARFEQKIKEIAGDQFAEMMKARLLMCPPHLPYLDLAGQDWNKLFAIGLNGMIREVRERIALLKQGPHFTDAVEKINWYEAVIISLEAVIMLARRYAELARQMLAKEMSPNRRAELEKIAEVCDWVPANPPRSFHEALQFHWFLTLCLEFERNNRPAMGLGRFDQYMWPYYAKDIREGHMTYNEAAELLGCLLVKGMGAEYLAADFAGNVMVDIFGAKPQFTTGAYGFTYTLGGVDKRGQDASNELSVLLVEALRQVKCHSYVHVLFHPAMAPQLVDKAIECNSEGGGNPAWYNDRHGTELLLGMGLPIEEAREWFLVGCSIVSHKAAAGSGSVSGWINHAKLLELALNNGVDPVSGERLGAPTGDPGDFRTFDQMLDAYKKQFEYIMDLEVRLHNATWAIGREDALYYPLTSACVAGQIELGIDGTRGSRYPGLDAPTIVDRALNCAADCLTSIKKLVFEEKKISMDALRSALAANFEGHDDIRQMCLSAPKYGSDDAEADVMAALVWGNATDRMQQYRTANEQRFHLMRQGASWAHWAGVMVGALPNGRKAGTPLYDSAASPMQGTDKAGVTGVLNSVTKVCDPAHVWGPILNQRFAPRMLQSKPGREKLAAVLRTYFDRPSFHIQFNVYDKQMLLDAQKHPEDYTNLLVRVAGYSAFWVELTPDVQNEILSRTEQGL